MSELDPGSVMADDAVEASTDLSAQLKELYNLSAEMVELFHTQIFYPDTISTPADVCASFSRMILTHWDLCCIVVYLRDETGHLRESALRAHEHFAEAAVRDVSAQFAALLERDNIELQAWLDDTDRAANSDHMIKLRQSLEGMGLRAGVAVPIHARGTLVGALVALTIFPERLRNALNGIRFIAAPVVIGVGNAHRAQAMREQHERIEQLVDQLQEHSSALEDANRELRHVAHYRSLFLSRMSHELRTPLTSILGFAEILLDHEELTDSQHRFCEKIQGSGLQLQTSLNQLVDLSRIEGGQSELFLHEFSLQQVLKDSCTAVERLAHKQGIKLECESDSNLPSIVSDEGKLRQVLYNFFAHAISRSPEGETVRVQAGSSSSSGFQIAIEDAGTPPAESSHIFEPVKLTAPTESAETMNELGLVIARRLLELLGGSVTTESNGSRGFTVLLELPIRPTESTQA